MTGRPIAGGPAPAPKTVRAVMIARLIDALPADHTPTDVFAFFGPDDYETFHLMDDYPGDPIFDDLRSPGTAHGEWHRRLRVARNDPDVAWPFR